MDILPQIEHLLNECTSEQRREIFNHLRREFQIHPLEAQLNVTAEVILAAIARASDLTQRGIRGVIAEAAFGTYVIEQLNGWLSIPPPGNSAYDFLIQDEIGQIRVQVKMQRLKNHIPMKANQAYRWLPEDMYVVETQRTRGGKHSKSGKDTRPYGFGEFDILAVSLHPSSGNWESFLYTVANWLIPSSNDNQFLLKFQPVPSAPNDTWTQSYEECVEWFRSGIMKKIL